MNRFFHAEHGAARTYLFSKLFLVMLALDTWILMIGHAGRYGMTGFNVAHFEWLDRVQPLPSAGFYIGVLVLVGLLALALVFTGIHPVSMFALFALYTFSWSMSMLDSYQHHYFMSLVLLCMVFFPQGSAVEIHPLKEPAAERSERRKRRARRERDSRETAGFVYAASVLSICAIFALSGAGGSLPATLLCLAALALATWLYRPRGIGGPHLHHGWGFSLLGATVAILYTFTAIAKMDDQWYTGATLLSISHVERSFGWLADYAERLGMQRQAFWGLFATAVIPQELFVAACYLVAVHQDRIRHPLPRVLSLLGFFAALALHLGAESMGLEIGWFSYYMLVLAVAFLLPLAIVDRLVTVLTWPARAVHRALRDWDDDSEGEPRAMPLLLAAGAGGLLAAIGALIDLPGAFAASLLGGVALFALTLWRIANGDRAQPKRWAAATLLAAFGMWFAIALSPVRFDFYRYLGGDLMRRDEPRRALEAYVHAERYAPEGKSRARKIRELRRSLGR